MKTAIPQPDRCIACTTCTVVCPIAQATPNFLGPRMVGPAHERFRLSGHGEDQSLHYCANCKNCDISCPNGVPVSAFIMRARAMACREKPPSLRDWVLAHGTTLARWLQLVPASLKNFGLRLPVTRNMLDLLGIAKEAPLPEFAAQNFRTLFRHYRQPENLPRSVAFFPGCYVDIYDPASGLDMVAVLNRAGYRVVLPEGFTCCGLPLVANGYWEEARRNAATNMREFATLQKKNLAVVTGCPSCALMVKADYAECFPELLPGGVSSALPGLPDLHNRPVLEDICEFLLDCLGRQELAPPDNASGQQVIYHAPCHLRAQGLGLPGLALLQSIPGLRVDNANAGCCGIAGSYGFKKDKYAIAMQTGSALFAAVRASRATVCVSDCGTCRVQIGHGCGIQTCHPVSLLRDCFDACPPPQIDSPL